MRLIGLTGGIATGKSTVAGMLADHGAVIVDADLAAREVLVPGAPAFDEVVARFGTAVLASDGTIDRAALGAMVFADAGLRGELEAITHPRIGELMAERIGAATKAGALLVVADIPLLFERGRHADYADTMLVYAPPAVQLRRMRERDGLDDGAARQRLAAQLPIDEKRALVTWVIDNGGTVEDTAAAVQRWWRHQVEGGGGP
jgi:dephospho-CoA kinase